ncbi:MAG TPA: class I SAM-dependent methyltransferase [Vicinamibacterales bacterium]|nr:class I SAM-dependent methyltransferase [Vicinamibacterales bacterium]
MPPVDQRCALCATQETRALNLESRLARIPFGGRIVACTGCGLRRVDPQPTAAQLEALYLDAVDAYREAGLDYVGGTTSAPAYLLERIEELERRLGSPGRLLDVGAGAGTLLQLASDRDWAVVGTERSAASAASLRARGFDIRLGDLSNAGWPDGTFDAIHLNHVLEHLPDPRASLRAARRLLRPGGLLAIEVPWEFADLPFQVRRVFGLQRPHRLPSQHLWFFSPATLSRTVGAAGLEVVSVSLRRDCDDPQAARRLAKLVVERIERAAGRGPLIVLLARAPLPTDA